MAKIVHLTSVHSPLDPRIFEKECATLAKAGHDVTLIVPTSTHSSTKGVRIRAVTPPRTRLRRMIFTTTAVFRAAVHEAADVYHFHDPELIPFALLLRRLGKRVIYDVHEDYPTGILQKEYLPRFVRQLVAGRFAALESFVSKRFEIILAEKYYQRRMPHGTLVLNYPLQDELPIAPAFSSESRRLLYTGNVSVDRGALHYARLARDLPEITVHLVGRCYGPVARQIRDAAGGASDRIVFEGIDTHVPFKRILDCYRTEQWLCGLAVFPSTPHYREKELTKFFEYMHAGLPVLCSDFPVWRDLIEKNGVGLCVAPEDPAAVARAVRWLAAHPIEAEQMGKAGQALVRDKFNWNTQATALLGLYERVLEGKRA